MKKKIICSSVLTAILSASSLALAGGIEVIPEPDYFSGFYVGGIGGVHHNTFSGSSQVVATSDFDIGTPTIDIPNLTTTLIEAGVISDSDISGGDFDGYGGVQGGFGKVFYHHFYAGVQGWGEWGNTSVTETQTMPVLLAQNIPILNGETALFVEPSAAASTSTTMKISSDYGVVAKLGWIVAPRSMFYGKIGASWANIKVSTSLDVDTFSTVENVADTNVFVNTSSLDTGTSSNSSTKIGLLLGIGFEQFVYQDVVSVNVEYSYVNYGHVSTTTDELTGSASLFAAPSGTLLASPIVADTDIVQTASTSVQVSSLMAGLNFYFGRDWI
jgi:opacity protein-like surface antigen